MSAPSGLIEAYLDGPSALRRALAGFTSGQLLARPVPGKWSTLEVVCHLVDSEQAWCHRMKRVIAESKPLLIGYDETKFAAALACHHRDLDQELALLEAMRQQMGRIFRTLPDAAWSFTGVHSEQGLITLEEMLRAETEHIPHHVGFIIDKRKALNLPTDLDLK